MYRNLRLNPCCQLFVTQYYLDTKYIKFQNNRVSDLKVKIFGDKNGEYLLNKAFLEKNIILISPFILAHRTISRSLAFYLWGTLYIHNQSEKKIHSVIRPVQERGKRGRGSGGYDRRGRRYASLAVHLSYHSLNCPLIRQSMESVSTTASSHSRNSNSLP